MKAFTILSIVGFFAAGAVATPASAAMAMEQKCGDLGVMRLDASFMEENEINPAQVRHCVEHPLGNEGASKDMFERDAMSDINAMIYKREQMGESTGLVDVNARACYNGLLVGGCSRGYCWKKCDLLNQGHWCWVAKNSGAGAWATCSADTDCVVGGVVSDACGVGNNCASCGCSC